eukprot:4943958-Amphidinium_carterae.1
MLVEGENGLTNAVFPDGSVLHTERTWIKPSTSAAAPPATPAAAPPQSASSSAEWSATVSLELSGMCSPSHPSGGSACGLRSGRVRLV